MTNETVTVEIPRSALTVVAPPPERVTQATSLEVFGLPPKTFAALCKRGAFPAAREGRLWVARCADVRSYLDSKTKSHRRTKADSGTFALPVGARRVGT
jgi:hypothetical protein